MIFCKKFGDFRKKVAFFATFPEKTARIFVKNAKIGEAVAKINFGHRNRVCIFAVD